MDGGGCYTKLRHRKEISPIVLTVRAEHAEICFHPLVVILDLSLRLRMIGGREAGFDSKPLVQAFCKHGGEGRSSVRSMYQRDSMQFPDVSDVQIHQVGSGDIGGHRKKVGHFHQSIGDDVDGIETTRFGEFTYEIRLNPLPRSVRSGNRLELSKFPLVLMFRTSAGMAPLDISFHPSCQVASPVAATDKLKGSRSS